MNTDRRNILKALGLSAASVAVSTEAIAAKGSDINTIGYFPHLDEAGPKRQLAMAEALETLARNMRESAKNFGNKDRKGETLVAISLDVHSSMTHGEYLTHEVKIKFEIYGDEPYPTGDVS